MVVKLVIAVVAAAVILYVGVFVLRAISTPMPEPEPGEMRKVNLRYRCSICGAEVRMTSAPDAMPEPPRHCMDEMQLVAPTFE
ncbi:MAG TPA: hypothetical protein VFK42_13345 [Acidimicrobiales bacterium]|nr:hypothetical protein [Acidimicrobiales bacterium]